MSRLEVLAVGGLFALGGVAITAALFQLAWTVHTIAGSLS